MGAAPVEIVGDPGEVSIGPPGEVLDVGDRVTVDAVGGKFGAQTDLEVRQGGVALQTLSIHTSCSKPLAEDDRFGSLILRVFVPQ